MEKKIFSFCYFEFESADELPESDRELMNRAKDVAGSAYAPYSQYRVGAAVRMGNGAIITGTNQENMAFPSGLCAERVALYAAASAYPGVPIEAVAITARSEQFPIDKPVPPCGSCRQAFIEYEMHYQRKIRVILTGEDGKAIVVEGMETLLPLSFREDGLRK